jgi:hypothetical protein
MLKVKTVGMINDNKKSFPFVNAHADIINGYFCSISDTETVALTASSAKEEDVYVVMNTTSGHDSYCDIDIKKGEKVNAFLVKEWDRQDLQLNEKHLTTAYASINVNDKLVAGTDGKLSKVSDVSGYALYFRVKNKVMFDGNGLEVQIIVA